MMDALKKDRSISFIVFGCGLAFGITGFYTYYKTRKTIKKEIRSMSLTIEALRSEIEELKVVSQRGSPIVTPAVNNFVTKQNGSPLKTRFRDEPDHRFSDVESEGEEEFYDFNEEQDNQIEETTIPSDVRSEDDKLVEVIKRIDKLFEDPSIDKAMVFSVVSQACENFGKPERLMYRRVKASNNLVIRASKEGDLEEKKKLAFKCVQHAKEALDLYPSSAECNKWYAIAIGGINDFVPTKEKIKNGSVFKDHVDKAIQLSPNDATLHHMLGRFCAQIAALSWVERKVASTLFAEVPQATNQDCFKHLKRAYELKKAWKENMVHLSKAAFDIGLLDEGRRYLEEGISLPIKGEDDELAHQDLLKLKAKYIK